MKNNNQERTETEIDQLVVVGIGASAGGLESLQEVVKHLPKKTMMTYVVAQHLSPTYRSMMTELLQRDSEIQVLEAKNGMVLKQDTMYICPPNKNIVVHQGVVELRSPGKVAYSPKPSVDLLFETIAKEYQSRSVGVILSGTGSDGSRGIRAIKAEEGFTIALEPSQAKYDGMPTSAINTGNIDLILSAEHIGQELLDIFSNPKKIILDKEGKESADITKNIIQKLMKAKNIDFSNYKENTIQRRIARRMAALKFTKTSQYNNYLNSNALEIDALFQDILIGVTSFFRDEEAFEGLRAALKGKITSKKEKTIRVWIPGCSTGEEPYSIAMVLADILGGEMLEWKIQIFATDIDEDALRTARRGLYPESALEGLDKRVRKRYFKLLDEQFEIIKPIRDMILFSRHDIISDPPFLKLDLVVCRNLLIYFKQELQKRLLPMFHYAVGEAGILFLGKSETVGQFSNLFHFIDKKWKLYEAIYIGNKERPLISTTYKYKEPKEFHHDMYEKVLPSVDEIMYQGIKEHFFPMCIMINEAMDIIYQQSQNPYVIRPAGKQNDNIFKNVHPDLALELRAGIHSVLNDKKTHKSMYQKVLILGRFTTYVRMIIAAIQTDENDIKTFMICFEEEDENKLKGMVFDHTKGSDQNRELLEIELERTREYLQTVVEELETSNEEMQSSNEELQSSNEELQSSNEELETTNEELQSTNEELQTAYTEMRNAYTEKERQEMLTQTTLRELEEEKTKSEQANDELKKLNSEKELKSQELEDSKRALLQYSNFLQESQAIANLGSFKWDVIKDTILWSDQLYKIFGKNKSNFTPNVGFIKQVLHPDDLFDYEKELEQSLISGRHDMTFRIIVNSEVKYIRALGKVVFNDQGEAIEMNGTAQDVTSSVKQDLVIKEIRSRIDSMVQNSLSGIYIFNFEEQQNTYINEQYTEFLGYSLTDLNDLDNFMALFHPDDINLILAHMDKMKTLKDSEAESIKYRFKHKEGHYIWCHSRDIIFEYSDKKLPISMLGTFLIINDDEQK